MDAGGEALDISELKFEQKHGKERIRIGRVWKNTDGTHSFVEWSVSISLLSDCLAAYTSADNSQIIATDTMKNTVYVKAKECLEQVSVEEFAIRLAEHFTSFYPQVNVCSTDENKCTSIFVDLVFLISEMVSTSMIKIIEKSWERVRVGDHLHEHGFKLGSERHTTEVILKKSGAVQISSGIEGLSLLKTTQSGFEGFIRDKYTILPETRERILATEITALWRYYFKDTSSIAQSSFNFTEQYLSLKKVLVDIFFGPPKEGVYSPSVQNTLYQMAKGVLDRCHDVSSIQLKMPNLHFLPVNLSSRDNSVIMKFEDDIYLPTDEPHGSIEASLSRSSYKI